jgi:hypothetical protein
MCFEACAEFPHSISTSNPMDELRQVIRTCPVIDNHGHNLLRPHGLRTSDFLTITSEATGEALRETPKTLAHLRAAKQLRKLYNLPVEADWNTIQQERSRILYDNPDGLTRKCLRGTQTILIDDGLGSADDFEPYQWHSHFTRSPCKRIVRIEAVAASILASLHQQWKLPVGISIADDEACSLAWVKFITAFEQAIAQAIDDDEVVGFKSVVCYRAGLGVKIGRDIEVTEAGLKSFMEELLSTCESRAFRVESKGMNDALVISTCKLIAAGYTEKGRAKPLQFHTGLGDNDISLLDSKPGMPSTSRRSIPDSTGCVLALFVSIHAGSWVSCDCLPQRVPGHRRSIFHGISKWSRDLRQALELTPMSKILWSTDGHLQAETYWLANVQGREPLEKIFVKMAQEDDLTVDQAVGAVEDILYNNSNKLYDLRLPPPTYPQEDSALSTNVSRH